ncbi:hypothetical protein PoB_005494900 [Plakobranchus ocellatus]|uniref:Uncharacterized protein n=1 Tax=Plakobranchus ocellatus TaxID=259542 RepID=A0AAV4C7B4_9GAST|nr:hypothetical protein PoB_005494900 [Plakobranchus ocellatus]
MLTNSVEFSVNGSASALLPETGYFEQQLSKIEARGYMVPTHKRISTDNRQTRSKQGTQARASPARSMHSQDWRKCFFRSHHLLKQKRKLQRCGSGKPRSGARVTLTVTKEVADKKEQLLEVQGLPVSLITNLHTKSLATLSDSRPPTSHLPPYAPHTSPT